MARIQLYTNPRPFVIPVTLGGGDRIQMEVDSNEAFFDEDGYVRLISMQFNDGSIGNFKLLPNNQTEDAVLRFCKDFLLPFGFTIASNAIFSGNTIVHNLAQELFERGSALFVNDLFERYSIANSSYYAIENGENVIIHPIQLQLG